MRRSGRVRSPPSAGVFLSIIYISACIAVTTCIDYGVPIEIKLWDSGKTPIAHMVDVTNEFGLKVLAEHNFLNDNNIAFSPYGLMGIMVALYEGVDGESSYQIQRGMQLPWNRKVMRIGFRDIHRTLKTYFVPEEGFLAGLALNNENVTFNDSYKKILRFYGFDLENDQLPILPPQANNTTNGTTTIVSTMNSDGESTTAAMTTENKPGHNTSTTTTREETTSDPNAETFSDVDVRKPTELTTMSPSSAPNAESTTIGSTVTTVQETSGMTTESTIQTIIATTTALNTPMPSTNTLSSTSNTLSSSTQPIISTVTDTPSASSTTNIPLASTMSIVPSTETIATAPSGIATDAETVAQQTSQATSALTDELTVNTEKDDSSTLDIASSATENSTPEPSTVTSTMTTSNLETGKVMTTAMSGTEQVTTTNIDMLTATESLTTNASTLETLQRRKKSIVDFIFTKPPYVEDYLLYRSYDIGPELPDPGFDDKMFLANGLRSVHVTYMHYDTVLEHAYLPHLEASALRLPLDSDRYYLLVVLPARGGAPELGRLLARMARESDLSDVYAALRPRRVRAVVPSFTVKGHVTLTTDLQKLGIRNVFEPRQRDFTLMTHQAGVYVRSIEQAVSVAIRKFRPDDQKKNRYVTNREPVTFSATYPFLYFVMDASIHVSLMAGKMVDPLNSRIL